MDQALKETGTSVAASWLMRGRREGGAAPADKIVTFMAPTSGSGPGGPVAGGAPGAQRDWSTALDLIREASEAIRISEERATDLEEQIRQLTAQAGEEIRSLESRIAAGERRLLKSEERAAAAEARAEHAEGWLTRLHDAVVGAFTRPQAPSSTLPPTSSDEAETPAQVPPSAE